MYIKIANGHYVPDTEISSIIAYGTNSYIKKIVSSAKEKDLFSDETCHKKSRSIIILKSNMVIVSSITTDTLLKQLS